ncbi:UNVERIFIED_CONTAM: hypothetical protein H355_012735, partial [Colinus virginianus]
MLPYLTGCYGNPHSRTHAYGWESEAATERARRQVADLIGADPREIIFTSGATESNNMAIKGVARFYKSSKKHIITTQTEHKCVLDSCRSLEAEGFQITYLPVQKNGLIDLKELEAAFQPDTSLVSVMTVNNEIGVKQPIRDIGEICRARKVFFHTDAAQAVGKIPVDVNDLKIDLMSISGHKIYGPKGEICRARKVFFHTDAAQAVGKIPVDVNDLKIDLMSISGHKIYGPKVDVTTAYTVERLKPHRAVGLSVTCNLEIKSACTSASLEPSYVLRAIGADEDLAHSSIRFGIGRFTTEEEIDYTVQKCIQHVKRLREM